MPTMIKQAVIFLSCVLLQACQPEFTRDQTERYARSVGVINQFDISRWHNRLIPKNTRIVMVSDVMGALDAKALSRVVAKGLAPYFRHTDGGYVRNSIVKARKKAKTLSADYLVFIELNDNSSIFNHSSPEEDSNYLSLSLSLNLVDVVSGDQIDKINLNANSSVFELLGDDMQQMLAQPLMHIGSDLTGSH